MQESRRKFLRNTGLLGLGFMGLKYFAESPLFARSNLRMALDNQNYGALVSDPIGILDLPAGFSYKIISRSGNIMSDGLYTPGRPDGMATFPLDEDRCIIIRNHELESWDTGRGAFGSSNELLPTVEKVKMYEMGSGVAPGLGGTTTLIFNLKTQTVEKEYLSLGGTIRNCAGGPTPWGSWLTCEETVLRETVSSSGGGNQQDHGYVFEVPASADMKMAAPIPIKEMGRFNHEAVAVDPRTGIVYLTEDRHDGLFYRYIPNTPGKLHQGGKLQALAIKGEKGKETRNWKEFWKPKMPINQQFEVEWIDMKNVDAPYDEMRYEGYFLGASRFARGEGIWFGEGELYFACTSGGDNRFGQVFRYVPGEFEGTPKEAQTPGKLEIFIEPNDDTLLKNCDNLTVAPWGDVIVVEDNLSPKIVGITPKGELYYLGHNVAFPSEFSGVCFSPEGSTMFVNIQHFGMTFAITGPWQPKK